MVSFIKLLATLSMFSATALTTPAPVPEGVDITVFDYSAAAELAQGLEARQEKTCLAFIGLGPPSSMPLCGLIGARPNTATTFTAATAQFPNCQITVEIAYPNCRQYRDVNVQNCGGERQIDIREAETRDRDARLSIGFKMIHPKWSRLVRFIAEDDWREHIGEPVDADVDVGAALASSIPVPVRVFTGTSALDTSAGPTSRVLNIQRLLPPLTRKEIGTIRCIGLNYRKHAKEMNLDLPEHPTLFFKPASCLNASNAPLVIPHQATDLQADYEAELAVVIGRDARNVSVENAMDYILGYICSNDVTARKHQFAGAQWGFGKGFDGFAPMGPCLVSATSIPDPAVIELKTVLNGNVMQEGRGDDMIFSIAEIVAYLSQGTTLEAGTVIMTGTPHGIGVSRTPPTFLAPGDDLRVVMSHGLGSLINRVEYEEEPVRTSGVNLTKVVVNGVNGVTEVKVNGVH